MIWCTKLPGFGLRTYPSGARVFVVQYKRDNRTRRLVLGKHPMLKADAARRAAVAALAAVAQGEDPAVERDRVKASPTVAELCASWLALGTGPTGKAKRASTLVMDRSRINLHVLPVLGTMKVRNVTPAKIRDLMARIIAGTTSSDKNSDNRRTAQGGPGVALRTLRMVKAIFAHAVRTGLIATNPAQHVQGGHEAERERFLSPAEMQRLAVALDAAERAGVAWQATVAIRLILATGLRRDQALALQWSEVDLDRRRLVLSQTKTGRSVRPLSRAGIAILSGNPGAIWQ